MLGRSLETRKMQLFAFFGGALALLLRLKGPEYGEHVAKPSVGGGLWYTYAWSTDESAGK